MRNLLILVIAILWLSINPKQVHAFVGGSIAPTQVPQDTLPVPKGIKNLLFYVQRDPNINTVVYELNVNAQGVLNEKEPVKIYWIRYAEKGERKDLSFIQRKFAYGLETKKLSPEKYELKFVSYSKLPLYLQKGTDGKYHVYTQFNQKQAMLNRAFVRIQGGTFWVPNVLYVDLIGREPGSLKVVTRRIIP
ncbi:MAG: DUF4833 domain-containing protein [Cytophagales bacterium CG18_big_fil_WC_8_21_14_2_50_42_9]|nr:MAG: DUF4833 domain-containing protein [Cytophagales bacterium CG18_big_fil_WC_8_21_14_2_50_42_9]